MELRVLRYFLTVVREENITRAAEVLHITQPTLSRQLSMLEEELGAKLMERGTRKITLTNEGALLRRRAEDLVALADKTEQEFVSQNETLGAASASEVASSRPARYWPGAVRLFMRNIHWLRSIC